MLLATCTMPLIRDDVGLDEVSQDVLTWPRGGVLDQIQ
jgi:hypothetical protein